jgi:hypothetical protein
MTDEKKKYLFTLPVWIEQTLKKEAKRNHRTKTAQLAAILEERYTPKQQPASAQAAQVA